MSEIVKPINGYVFRSAHGKCSECGAVGFHTKNIEYFGARTVYDLTGGCDFMKNRNTTFKCDDHAPLETDFVAHRHVAGCRTCQEYGY